MFERIFVPLDGSEQAERALPVAAHFARSSGGTLILIYVVFPSIEYGAYTVEQIAIYPTAFEGRLMRASAYLNDVINRSGLELVDIKIGKVVTSGSGSSAPAIFKEARLYHADLIVLGHSRENLLKRWTFHSLVQQAVRHSPVPVLVLNDQDDLPALTHQEHPLNILIPLDGSLLSEVVLEPTIHLMAALAGPHPTKLHLLQIIDGEARSSYPYADEITQQEKVQQVQNYLHAVANRLLARVPAERNLSITSSVIVNTDVVKTLLAEESSKTDPYDFMAIATHGQGGLQRLLMGGVTEHLLYSTRLPLLIVRSREKTMLEEKSEQLKAVEVSDGDETCAIPVLSTDVHPERRGYW